MKRTLHILFACTALLLSCAKEMDLSVQPVQEVKTYTLTVKAGKGGRPDTKALEFSEISSELMAEWAVGEEVNVYKGDTYLGTITAQDKGKNATLSGTITGDIKKDDVLTLKFLSPDYANQDGTIEYIAAHCDFAQASITVTSVEGIHITTTLANFVNQQAIVKFILKDAANPATEVQAQSLVVDVAEQITITVTSATAKSELFVAIPAVSSRPVSLKARKGSDVYLLNKYGISLEMGKYYNITAKLNKAVEVTSETALNKAISDGESYILLGANIKLSGRVNITGGKTVTLDLCGYTLDRGLSTPTNDGNVIYVDNTSTLTINDSSAGGTGTITGGDNMDNYNPYGGGICNNGTLTVNGGRITGNTSEYNGGGIYNSGTATINGGVIANNTTGYFGAGINNSGTLTLTGGRITGNTAGNFGNGAGIWSYGTLNMQGVIDVTGNTISGSANNVCLSGSTQFITVTGSLAGSHIGITRDQAGTFTSGYSTYGGGEDPTTVFSADKGNAVAISLNENGEAQISSAFPSGTIYYIERSWDNTDKKAESTVKTVSNLIAYDAVPTTESDYKEVNTEHDWFALGGYNNEIDEYYVVRSNISHTTLNVLGKNVHLILCDGIQLILSGGILMYGDHNLYIHCQSYGTEMGRLVVNGGYGNKAAGIGSDNDGSDTRFQRTPGKLEIHGGNIYAKGCDYGAGIGGGSYQNGGEMIVYGGRVEGHGGKYGAGIGGGEEGKGGTITIYDGYVLGIAGRDAAGIGGGDNEGGSTIYVHGGTVIGYGNYNNEDSSANGAGIGSGDGFSGGDSVCLTVTGGHVEGYGGVDASGIGGGDGDDGGTINISGGYVYSQGNGGASGMGAGDGNTAGPYVTITGGTVIAKAGEGGGGRHRAIGIGYYIWSMGIDPGERNIGPRMMVQVGNTEDVYERIVNADERADACYDYSYARIEPCTHEDSYYTVTGAGLEDTHTLHCKYCTLSLTEKHNIVGGVCSVCGVSAATIHTVTVYQPVADLNPKIYPADDGKYDAPIQSQVSEGSVYILPQNPIDRQPAGMEFAGWLAGGPQASFVKDGSEELLGPGTSYTITTDVMFTARYTLAPDREITLYDDDSAMGDNTNPIVIEANDTKYFNSVTISGRTLYRDGSVNSLCLPFELKSFTGTPLDGATVKTLVSASYDNSERKLTLHFGGNYTSLEAGKPYLVLWETPQGSNIVNPEFRSVYMDKDYTVVDVTMTGDVTSGAYVSFRCNWSYSTYNILNPLILYFGADHQLHYPGGVEDVIFHSFTGNFYLYGVLANQCDSIVYTVN